MRYLGLWRYTKVNLGHVASFVVPRPERSASENDGNGRDGSRANQCSLSVSGSFAPTLARMFLARSASTSGGLGTSDGDTVTTCASLAIATMPIKMAPSNAHACAGGYGGVKLASMRANAHKPRLPERGT